MQSLRHPLFLVCFALFCLNQFLEQAQVYVWPLHAYLDDLLCLPISLQIILAVQRAYFKNPAMVLPARHIAFAVIAYSVCFEWLLPLYKPVYTSDSWDVLAYAIGAVVFYTFLNKPLRSIACQHAGMASQEV
ncbi:magnesium citrate secondary transporter [Pontibacter sp. CAU 1760]